MPLDDSGEPSIGKTSDVPRRTLGEQEIHAILQQEAANYRATIEQYEGFGRTAEANRLRLELALIETYL